jgi:hypothetical protein
MAEDVHSDPNACQASPRAALKGFDGLKLHYGLNKTSPNYDMNAADNRVSRLFDY